MTRHPCVCACESKAYLQPSREHGCEVRPRPACGCHLCLSSPLPFFALSIWGCVRAEGTWGPPLAILEDMEYMYFVTGIWVCVRADGTWGPPPMIEDIEVELQRRPLSFGQPAQQSPAELLGSLKREGD